MNKEKKRQLVLSKYSSQEKFETVRGFKVRLAAISTEDLDFKNCHIQERVNKIHGMKLTRPHLSNIINFLTEPSDEYVRMIDTAISYFERKVK